MLLESPVDVSSGNRAVHEQLLGVLHAWSELVRFSVPAHRIADFVRLVAGFDLPHHATLTLDEWSVQAIFHVACDVHAEWPMCCLLRRLGQLKAHGRVEVVWLTRALACWAAVAQGHSAALFAGGGPEIQPCLTDASWTALIAEVRDDVRDGAAPSVDEASVMNEVSTRVLLALLGWQSAAVTRILHTRTTSHPNTPPVMSCADVVLRVQYVCAQCAHDHCPLPTADLIASVVQRRSSEASPRPRPHSMAGAELCWHTFTPPPAVYSSSSPGVLEGVTDAKAITSYPTSRRDSRRHTLPPQLPQHPSNSNLSSADTLSGGDRTAERETGAGTAHTCSSGSSLTRSVSVDSRIDPPYRGGLASPALTLTPPRRAQTLRPASMTPVTPGHRHHPAIEATSKPPYQRGSARSGDNTTSRVLHTGELQPAEWQAEEVGVHKKKKKHRTKHSRDKQSSHEHDADGGCTVA